MDVSGITAQYGFLFQRKAFTLYVIKNVGANQLFTFEGRDDVDISFEDKIYTMKDCTGRLIQVKSGHISENSFSKIVCNWLLADEADDHELMLENDLSFEYASNERARKIYEFILDGKKKKTSSIARKTHDKYKSVMTADPDNFIEQIETLISNVKTTVLTIDGIDSILMEKFCQAYCSDIANYEKAKAKRLERFLSYINSGIDDAIKMKKPYVLPFDAFMRLITKVSDEISDTKYTIDARSFKNKSRETAKRIVNERITREVKQLYLVNNEENFVISEIINELMYKDFRSVYEQQKELEISNLEQNAKENYESAKFAIGDNANDPRELYINTTERSIESDLIPSGSIYRKGCYVFLTGDDVEEDIQITWGDDNDSK